MSNGPSDKRLIEVAFPLQQTSLDSVHEKNVRHGHISTLHIWPARRPLAASRAALIATLLPDPGDPQKRKEVLERLGGRLVAKDVKKTMPSGKTEIVKTFETVGGILHWGRESGPDLEWFRDEIKKAYGGRAPKVLDPFAGGGAIPLEAMRLGCEVTAADINPVAWFLLKCTLDYPQKVAGQKRRLPDFAIADREFMATFFKSQGLKGAALRTQLTALFGEDGAPRQVGAFDEIEPLLEADLAWHVRAWGRWVLKIARKELAPFYPTYASFETLDGGVPTGNEEAQEFVPLNSDGIADVSALNREFPKEYLENPTNPRWIAKPTVAYLWARAVGCKNCRATVPLLKTRWLCKKEDKRVVLEMTPKTDKSGVEFSILRGSRSVGQNAAARREYDRRLGAGNMSRSGAKCPCCGTIMTMEDVRLEGRAGRLSAVMTAVVVDGQHGKEYRSPTAAEIRAAHDVEASISNVFRNVPFGMPTEPTPKGGSGASRAFSVGGYGIDQWHKLFLSRQLVMLGTWVGASRSLRDGLDSCGYSLEWKEGIQALLACAVDRLADYNSTTTHWQNSGEFIVNTFQRFALPISWDFSEVNVLSGLTGSYYGAVDWVALVTSGLMEATARSPSSKVLCASAIQSVGRETMDVIVTDPPYYDAIPYSDLMDFFYIWLRRTTHQLSPEIDEAFANSLGPKWDSAKSDGELIDDASRFGGDKNASKKNYEDGMARAFIAAYDALRPDGRFVIVFAHKHPDAWETLVAAIIRAGFVVDASWPIKTEMGNRTRALTGAALSSSVWLVCRKRPETARPGWDNRVLEDMHHRITTQLREFWDAGIRGPDFVWAATGPALEAYSQHPVVKKANSPGELMGVTEFLQHVRRIVVDFVVGRVLSGDGDARDEASGLDDVTSYYLLHRHDFGFADAPVGACILYAVSCGLSDRELSDQFDLVSRAGGSAASESDDIESDEEDGEEASERSSGSALKLKGWNQRKAKDLGLDAPRGKAVPLIDQVHRIMRLWKAGDVVKVNEYLDQRALRSNQVFHQLLQALIELAPHASEERSLLESISNHVAARGVAVQEEMNVYSAE